MPLDVGSKLGPYEIVSLLGSEVYKATHTEDSRTVTLRVLPPDWAGEAEFPQLKERFEVQAQVVASLSHPNIGLLYDIGQQDGVDFVVSEYVEGDTLAARLERGALPLGQAMQVALEIGDALDKAHRAGVVHRDLNPSSIVLAETGAKLLDFGLAELRAASPAELVPKASSATVGVGGPKMSGDIGIEYTAPELFEAKPADARTDIFAYGAILYEMVTGKKAFEGRSRAVLIAAITTADPLPLTSLQPRAPRALEHLVDRCLAKDPENRWQAMHDLMVKLRRMTARGVSAAPVAVDEEKSNRWRRLWLGAAAFAAVVLAVPAALYFRGPAPEGRFQFRVPSIGIQPSGFALSPDGQTIALVARPESQESSSLYVKRTGGLAFNRLLGTDDATQPFWSPDNRFIAFVSKGRLRKVSVDGGAPQDIAEAAGFSGGAWNREGIILFGTSKGLQRVSAEGGKPAAVTTPAGKENGHLWPAFLPDERRFLYLAWSAEPSDRAVFAGSLDSKDKTRVMAAATNAVYAPGFLLFHREASVFAQKFDAKNLSLSGEPVHVADEVFSNPANGRASFAVSQNGVLAYYQGAGAPAGRAGISVGARFAWFDRGGKELAEGGEAGSYGDMDASPDGKLIALTRQDGGAGGADIWVVDWQRAGASTRLTLDPADDINPVWSPDGNKIAFTSYRKGNADIYVKNANGSGTETPLLDSPVDEMVEDWSKDGQSIAYLSGQNAVPDIYVLPLTGDKKPFAAVQGNFKKNEPQFSYDGKWLAYTSDESGTFQVYVMSLPAGEQKLMVSTDGGGQPRWRKDGKEIIYRALDGRVMGVDIKTGGKLESSVPRLLFLGGTGNPTARDPARHMLSVTADGQRILLRALQGGTRMATASSTVPFVQLFASGQAGGLETFRRRGGMLADITNGLTVVQNWTAGVAP